jgi:hypothetical protein
MPNPHYMEYQNEIQWYVKQYTAHIDHSRLSMHSIPGK